MLRRTQSHSTRVSFLTLFAAGCLCVTVVQPVVAQQKSVKPGINKSFDEPDVAQFVERFEREGREIYDLRKEAIKACGIQPKMSVADVGAGTGLYTRLFAKAVGPKGRVFAVDIADKFIAHIKQTCREQGITNVTGIVCSAQSAKLPKSSVDIVFICDTYHHFEFPQKTMASIRSALRPDGSLCVVDFERIEGKSSDWVKNHVRAGKETFKKEIEEAGFVFVEEIKLFRDNYFLKFRKRDS